MNILKMPVGKVAVIPDKAADKTDGGILLPDDVQDEITSGRVIAIGCDVTRVSIGDKVIYSKYGIENLGTDHGNAVVMDECGIYCIDLRGE